MRWGKCNKILLIGNGSPHNIHKGYFFPMQQRSVWLSLVSLASLIIVVVAVVGCDEGKYAQFRHDLQVGSVVPLLTPPDSAYIANLDAMLAAEVLVDPERPQADVAMALSAKPMVMPRSGKGVGLGGGSPTGTTASNATAPNPLQHAVEKGVAARPVPGQPPQKVYEFVPGFMQALDRLVANPSSGQSVRVQPGEDLEKLLRRHYGSAAGSLPLSVVRMQLSLANPGIDLEAIPPGAAVVLPHLH